MLLQAQGIFKHYAEVEVLKGVSLAVKPAEVLAIVGASGAGKSTLLRILGTLEPADEGEILLSGMPLQHYKGKALARIRNQKIGFVFQFHRLLPEFTAWENVCLPGYIAGGSATKVRKEARALLMRLGLAGRLDQVPAALSGGEAQRVAIARALVNRPEIVYADEPTGNLDSAQAEALYTLFSELRREYQQTFVIVTHNEALAAAADRTLHMSDGRLS